ncbi:MAG: hypothetical protein ABI873_02385 [Marmoricola sp.]
MSETPGQPPCDSPQWEQPQGQQWWFVQTNNALNEYGASLGAPNP